MKKGKPSTEERFMNFVIPEPNSGCWLWLGTLIPSKRGGGGYGGFHIRFGVSVKAHRFSYEMHKGPIPYGLIIDHLCRLRCCVNPDHLEAVTHQENTLRGLPGQKRRTHCPKGHPYDEDRPRYRTECRTCHRDRERRRRERLGQSQ